MQRARIDVLTQKSNRSIPHQSRSTTGVETVSSELVVTVDQARTIGIAGSGRARSLGSETHITDFETIPNIATGGAGIARVRVRWTNDFPHRPFVLTIGNLQNHQRIRNPIRDNTQLRTHISWNRIGVEPGSIPRGTVVTSTSADIKC